VSLIEAVVVAEKLSRGCLGHARIMREMLASGFGRPENIQGNKNADKCLHLMAQWSFEENEMGSSVSFSFSLRIAVHEPNERGSARSSVTARSGFSLDVIECASVLEQQRHDRRSARCCAAIFAK